MVLNIIKNLENLYEDVKTGYEDAKAFSRILNSFKAPQKEMMATLDEFPKSNRTI